MNVLDQNFLIKQFAFCPQAASVSFNHPETKTFELPFEIEWRRGFCDVFDGRSVNASLV